MQQASPPVKVQFLGQSFAQRSKTVVFGKIDDEVVEFSVQPIERFEFALRFCPVHLLNKITEKTELRIGDAASQSFAGETHQAGSDVINVDCIFVRDLSNEEAAIDDGDQQPHLD